MEAPGLHETNFNTQHYNDAIGLTSRWKVCFRQTFFSKLDCSSAPNNIIVALLAKNDFSPDITSWHPYKTVQLVLQFWKWLPRPFLATPISIIGKILTFDKKVVETQLFY